MWLLCYLRTRWYSGYECCSQWWWPGLRGSFTIGFCIFPDGRQSRLGNNIINDKISSGSLLTVAFQILVDSVPTAKLSLGSVATVNNLISCTVDRIKTTLNCENAWILNKASAISHFGFWNVKMLSVAYDIKPTKMNWISYCNHK